MLLNNKQFIQKDILLVGSFRNFSSSSVSRRERLVILGSGWGGYNLLQKVDRNSYDVRMKNDVHNGSLSWELYHLSMKSILNDYDLNAGLLYFCKYVCVCYLYVSVFVHYI